MQWRLFALCLLAFFITGAQMADWAGVGARPWYGWWDANTTAVAPYTLAFKGIRPDGATARAGIAEADRFDIRKQSLPARLGLAFQLMGDRPTVLAADRNGSIRSVTVHGSSIWEGATQWKAPALVSINFASTCFAICALLLAFRSRDPNARTFILALLFLVSRQLDPTFMVMPWPAAQLVLAVASRLGIAIASLLLIRFALRTGAQSWALRILTPVATTIIALFFISELAAIVGFATLWFDPLVFTPRLTIIAGFRDATAFFLVAAVSYTAVRSTPQSERPRAAWLLLPLPFALFAAATLNGAAAYFPSWFVNVSVVAAGGTFWLLGASAVAYALLNRRVLDIEFVLGRTLVVGIVSAIIVGSFILLEFVLNSVLTGVSHITGVIANAGLALVLGFSINAIHQRVDSVVEGVLFRKRLDDERALRNFAKEAAFVTSTDALLEQASEKLNRHTDARTVEILLDGTGSYGTVSENDPAILALKAHHAPVDPHHYQSAIVGALALPMLTRGRLLGIVVLGERHGGEAYAPDEIEALAQLAQGVGSALDALSALTPTITIEQSVRSEIAPLRDRIDAIARKLDA